MKKILYKTDQNNPVIKEYVEAVKKGLPKRRELRTIWNTNSPHGYSGYSVEMKDVLYRLAKDGWPIAISAFFGVEGGAINIEYPENENPKLKGIKIKHYPKMGSPYGTDAMFYHSQDWKAHAVFSMQDIWTLDPNFLQKIPVWIPWLPIDKDPVPQNVLSNLRYAYKIMTFSRFGHKLLQNNGFASTLLLEGTDTEIFKPMDQKEARKKMGIPQDIFLFAMVAANKENPPRKGFQEALQAFKIFYDKHPEAAIIFSTQQVTPTGFPIKEFGVHLGIQNRMFFVDDYLAMFKPSSKAINTLLNASDALLHPSQTEGFGLTIIEAQAAGKPVIIQNSHSMPELIIEGKTGFGANTLYKRFTPDLSYVNTANPQSVYECMEKTYTLIKNNPEQVVKDCRDFIVKNYNIDTLVEKQWIPFLEDLQEDLLPEKQLTKTSKVANMVTAR